MAWLCRFRIHQILKNKSTFTHHNHVFTSAWQFSKNYVPMPHFRPRMNLGLCPSRQSVLTPGQNFCYFQIPLDVLNSLQKKVFNYIDFKKKRGVYLLKAISMRHAHFLSLKIA